MFNKFNSDSSQNVQKLTFHYVLVIDMQHKVTVILTDCGSLSSKKLLILPINGAFAVTTYVLSMTCTYMLILCGYFAEEWHYLL